MSPDSCKRPWHRLHVATLVVLSVVVAASVARNLAGNYRVTHRTIGNSVRSHYVTSYGWPLEVFRRGQSVQDGKTIWLGNVIRPRYRTPFGRFRTGFPIAFNSAVVLLMAVSTTLTTEYWMRHRRGPFQFGLRSIFVLTALSAVLLVFTHPNEVDWRSLLVFPIAYACVSIFVAAGIVLEQWCDSADARLTRARRKGQTWTEDPPND